MATKGRSSTLISQLYKKNTHALELANYNYGAALITFETMSAAYTYLSFLSRVMYHGTFHAFSFPA